MREEKEINQEFDKHKKELDAKIAHIISQQQRLENYLATLEATNSRLEQNVQLEKDQDKRTKMYTIMRHNFETILKIHETYKDYEGVKATYYKLTTDLIYRKNHFIEIEMRKADAHMDSIGATEIIAILNRFTSSMNSDSGKLPISLDLDEKFSSDQFKL